MLRLTDNADETGRWCAPRVNSGGIPPEHIRDGPRFHFAFGFRTTQRLARMLDSLVRVSRRVGWRADRFATDPVPAGPPQVHLRKRSADTVAQSPPVEHPKIARRPTPTAAPRSPSGSGQTRL
ncbi:hypothetical protein V1264_014882 [Littorina saxatilis]|uniref:Uncharacterized protein n=1 Tax=Littorina saxatilis TaxID=31220 RepID=A0AAN9BIB0_9CAEN